MKKRNRCLLVIVMLLSIVLVSTNYVKAASYTSETLYNSGGWDGNETSGTTVTDSHSLFKFTASNGETNRSGNKFFLRELGKETFCVDPKHLFSGNVTYTSRDFTDSVVPFDQETACRISYLILSGYTGQERQTAIWKYVDPNGSYEALTSSYIDQTGNTGHVEALLSEMNALSYDSSLGGLVSGSIGGDVSITNSDNLKFTYEQNNNRYVTGQFRVETNTSTTVKLEGATGGSYLIVNNSSTTRETTISSGTSFAIAIPANEVNGSTTATVKIHADGGTYTLYTPADFYEATANFHMGGKDYTQMLASGNKRSESSGEKNFTVSVDLKVGSISVAKLDEHNNYVDGATFSITSDCGYNTTITTANKQAYVIRNIPLGNYTVTETNVPSGLYNGDTDLNGNPRVQTKSVTASSENNPVIFVRKNPYQTGKVKLVKKDADYNQPMGACNLAGAEYTLYAVGVIKQGDVVRYDENDPNKKVVAVVTTDENGQTREITGLPVGHYYYLETKAPEGYVNNDTRVDVEIVAQDQYTRDAATRINNNLGDQVGYEWKSEALSKDKPIHVNLVLNKILGATDYEKEINLAGVAFTATYIKGTNPDGSYILDNSQVYTSHGTDGSHLSGQDGKCYIDHIPYGKYLIQETDWPDEALPADDFEGDFTKNTGAYDGKVYDYTVESKYRVIDDSKTIQIAVNKMIENEFVNKTDAEVSGAVFTVYLDAECTQPFINEFTGEEVKIGPTNDDGYAISGTMRTRNYWLKETTFPEHMESKIVNPHATDFDNPAGTTYENMIYAVPASNTTQTVKNVINTKNIKNKPYSGKVMLVKYDDENIITDESLPVGAKVRLTLDSNPETYYDIVVDRYGYIEFENQQVKEMYYSGKEQKDCFTIPYGIYTLTEIKESDSGNDKDWYFQNRKVQVVTEDCVKPIIEADNEVKFMLNIVKRDADTNSQIILPNAEFKLWNCKTNDWVVQKEPLTHNNLTSYKTNAEGHLELPEPLLLGDYVLYEVNAPKGYFLEENLRIPKKENGEEDRSKLGNAEYGGKLISVNKEDLLLDKEAEYPTNPVDEFTYVLNNLVYTTQVKETPLKFKIELYKTGDMFTGIKEETTNVNGENYTSKVPQFTKEGLNGVTFKITALEDIKSEDGTQTYRNAGWSTTMTTGENGQADGYAVSEDLYNGKYRVEEIVTPVGYQKCDAFEVNEYNYDQYTEVLQVSKEADNEYQPATIKFRKLFENHVQDNYPIYLKEGESLEEKTKEYYAVFGLYNKNEIRSAKNNITLDADTLMYVVTAKSGEEGKLTAKMPDDEYYFKELYVTNPYLKTDDEYVVNVDHRVATNVDDAFEVNGPEMPNYLGGQDFTLLKTTTSDILRFYEIPSVDKETDEKVAKEKFNEYSDEMNVLLVDDRITIDEIMDNLKEKGIRLLTSAQYELYADEELTTHMVVSYDNGNTFNRVVVESSEKIENGQTVKTGVYKIIGLPEGEYYLKETVAPTYMDKNGIVHEFDLYEEPMRIIIIADDYAIGDSNPVRFELISDDSVRFEIDKTDIFTDEGIPNCLFTITDSEGTEKLRFVTDEEGKSNIPTDIFDDGETYYFTELDAPKYPYYDGDVLYELNTEPHKFIAFKDEDGKWKFKADDEEEDEEVVLEKIKIQNYRTRTEVELQKLDMVDSTPIPNCKFVLKGIDTDFEEEGVTDENGVYIFKDVPYGKYTYTELEAPEGWLIDTTPHEFTLDSHGTKIVVYDERAIDVDTGDIAVIAIACIAVVSVAGIAFVIIKKKKSSSSK